MNPAARRRRDILAVVVLLILPACFYWRAVLQKQTFFLGDVINIALPLRAASAQALRSGRLPLWTADIFCGYPLCADPGTGVYYPLTFLLLHLLPVHATYTYGVLIHLGLAGAFLYAYTRVLGFGRPAGLVSAMSFALGGFLLSHINSLHVLQAVTFLSLELLLIEMFFRRGSFLWLILTALPLAFQLIDHPQYFVYGAALVILYSAFKLLCEKGEGRRRIGAVVCVVGALAIAVGLASVILCPMWEQAALSIRQRGVQVPSLEGATPPRSLVTFFLPQFYWDCLFLFQDNTFYVGALPLVLALIAALRSRDRYAKFFTGMAIAFTLLALGGHTPLYGLVLKIPGLAFFRNPHGWSVLSGLSLAILAGQGLEVCLRRQQRRRCVLALAPSVLALAGTVTLLLAAPRLVVSGRKDKLAKVVGGVELAKYADDELLEAQFEKNLLDWLKIANPRMYAPLIAIGLAIILGGALLFWPRAWLASVALVVVLYDMAALRACAYCEPYICGNDLASPKVLDLDPSLRVLESHRQDSRILRFRAALVNPVPKGVVFLLSDKLKAGASLRPEEDRLIGQYTDSYMMHGIRSAYGYTSLISQRIQDVVDRLERPSSPEEFRAAAKLIDVLNVRHILSRIQLESWEPRFRRLRAVGDILLYENEQALPRALLVPEARVVSDPEQALAVVTGGEVDWKQEVVLEEPVPLPNASPAASLGKPRADKWDSTEVDLSVECGADAYLVLSDTHYPGWRAYRDGVETRIHAANYVLRAVAAKAGDHVVSFRYDPASVRFGLFGSLISAGALAMIAVMLVLRKGRQSQ